ncbi:acyl-CoA dehydrogenase family protein [Aquihabitans sp. McL0605]|uniref:acyl-CoA dehydrogenase family protein n=1 Tax=Aquihabitans sp. McL0605 TaxID=3415671 RepID=UPI003CE92F4B
MSIAIGDDQQLLADAVGRFATDRCPPDVARAASGGGDGQRPPFWDDLAALGWLALQPDDGLGFGELAVVLEGLGRAVAPGGGLPTAWAIAVARAGGLDPTWSAATVAPTARGPVLGAAGADAVIVPLEVDGEERWFAIDRADVATTRIDALDATRSLAELSLDPELDVGTGAEGGAGGAGAIELRGVTRRQVQAIGITLAAAEAVGGASWCVDTAAAYAKDRRQFGRPIGQFQAVKHRCADMLVRLEQARAVAWDAAAALDGDDPYGPSAQVAVAAAGAIALDAFVDVAKDCIQVLGGIGFTWEHDAHLYLRRAVALRQLFGGPRPWRNQLATAAIGGTRRHLQLELPPEADALRAGIAATIDEIAALPKADRRTPLADAGLIVPHWSAPWGRDAGAVEQLVIDQELRRAKVRVPHLTVGAWAAPTIAAHGTVEQQERWVGPTLRGEIEWCQLFSEPEAGSDLAALTTAATKVDGGWLLNGQKVWTTMAKEADWGICLARTNPTAPKHQGITYFIVDMATPGLDIRPLKELTGMEMFNEVFLNDVLVPDDCVIGEVDGGWPLARTTLANERVSMGSGSSFGGGIEALVGLVADRIGTGLIDGDDPIVLDDLGALVAEAHSLSVMGLRSAVRSVTGAKPGPEASVRKLLGVEHDQRTQELGLALLGPEGATNAGAGAQWTFGFLANRCLTIAGGTSEIQRNVIGERLLGLPRDPEPSS